MREAVMRRKIFWAAAPVGLALAGSMLVGVPAASAATDVSSPTLVPTQNYYWKWTDGGTRTRRTFYQSVYGVESNLPGIRVSVRPIYPQRKAKLQYWNKQRSRWMTEDGPEYTNSQTGSTVLRLDAHCSGGGWCNGTFKYRVRLASKVKYLRITFVAD
jgi:hypothetical protein